MKTAGTWKQPLGKGETSTQTTNFLGSSCLFWLRGVPETSRLVEAIVFCCDLKGVIKLIIFWGSNNANAWWFWGISNIIVIVLVGNIMTHVESTFPKRGPKSNKNQSVRLITAGSGFGWGYVNFQVGMASEDRLWLVVLCRWWNATTCYVGIMFLSHCSTSWITHILRIILVGKWLMTIWLVRPVKIYIVVNGGCNPLGSPRTKRGSRPSMSSKHILQKKMITSEPTKLQVPTKTICPTHKCSIGWEGDDLLVSR